MNYTHVLMVIDSTQPATQADVKFLADLVTNNGNAIETHGQKIDSLEERMDCLEKGVEQLDDRIMAGFMELKKMINGFGKHLCNHEDRIEQCEKNILALESAA